MFSLALGGRVEAGQARELVFGGVELERRIAHLGRQPLECYFAVRVGPGFKIKLSHARETIGYMHFDRNPVDSFGLAVGHREREGAWPGTAIDHWNLQGWRGRCVRLWRAGGS